jgi:hypothetical protein
VKEERNIVHTIKRRKANWIGHILRRNRLLKHVIEGKLEGRIEMTGRRGRRRKQLLDDLKEKILEIERGSTGSHTMENPLWKGLRTCRKTDCTENNHKPRSRGTILLKLSFGLSVRLKFVP